MTELVYQVYYIDNTNGNKRVRVDSYSSDGYSWNWWRKGSREKRTIQDGLYEIYDFVANTTTIVRRLKGFILQQRSNNTLIKSGVLWKLALLMTIRWFLNRHKSFQKEPSSKIMLNLRLQVVYFELLDCRAKLLNITPLT